MLFTLWVLIQVHVVQSMRVRVCVDRNRKKITHCITMTFDLGSSL